MAKIFVSQKNYQRRKLKTILALLWQSTGCWQHKWPSKFLTLMKYIFLKPFGHKDSSGVCSFVQIHPYFFTIVSASIFLLTLADFACTFMIFKKMLLCRDGFGKNYVCHLILHDLGVSKKYILSVLEIFMVITFPAPCVAS